MQRRRLLTAALFVLMTGFWLWGCRTALFSEADSGRSHDQKQETGKLQKIGKTETATFAAGCFWGVEDRFRKVRGVVSTRVGYTGGRAKNPSYREVCSNTTGHAESVEIRFDPAVVTYEELLNEFFSLHDPTQGNRQGPDVGMQYRSAVFYHDEVQKEAALKAVMRLNQSGKFDRPIETQVLPATEFYEAEEYHQQYYQKLRKKS